LLNGTKTWVTNAASPGAAGFCEDRLPTRAEGNQRVSGGAGFAGFRAGRHEDKMGSGRRRPVKFVEYLAWVPVENRWARGAGAEDCVERSGRWGGLGLRRRRLAWRKARWKRLFKYAKQRKAFGKSISEFQAIQWDDCGHADGD